MPYAVHSQNQPSGEKRLGRRGGGGGGREKYALRLPLSKPEGRAMGELYLTFYTLKPNRGGKLYLMLYTLRTSGEKKGRTIPYALHSQNRWGEQWANYTLRSALSKPVGGRTILNVLHSQNQNDCSLDKQR